MARTRDYPIHDDEKRYIALWRKHGGGQHGPHEETVTMQYLKFFEFCRELESHETRRADADENLRKLSAGAN